MNDADSSPLVHVGMNLKLGGIFHNGERKNPRQYLQMELSRRLGGAGRTNCQNFTRNQPVVVKNNRGTLRINYEELPEFFAHHSEIHPTSDSFPRPVEPTIAHLGLVRFRTT